MAWASFCGSPPEGCGILADHEYASGAVQASAVKNRTPLDTKICRRIDIRTRIIAGEGQERLRNRPWIKNV